MQFTTFSTTVSGNTILVKNEIPIQYVEKIQYYTENSSAPSTFSKKEVRWSFNTTYWSAWEDLTQRSLAKIDTKHSANLFLEMRYVTKVAGTGYVNSVVVNYTQYDITCIPCEPGTPAPEIPSTEETLYKDITNKYIVTRITDASTLNGYPGSWYLDRSHHTGYQSISTITGLQAILNELNNLSLATPKNATGPGSEVFKEIDGSTWWFRRINASTGIIIVQDSSKINISVDPSIKRETLWSDKDPVSADVGGVYGGYSVPVGSNSIQVLEKILYEYFPPRISLNINPSSGYYEKWVANTSDVSIYGSFNNLDFVKVRIYDVSAYDNLSGGIGHISYPDISSGTFVFTDSGLNSNWDNVVYTIKIYNKVGTTFMTPAEASTSLTYVNPYTWGVVDNSVNVGNIDQTIIKEFINKGNKIIRPKQSNEIDFVKDSSLGMKIKFMYAYDASYGMLDSIFDVRNNFNVTTSFDTTVVNLTGIGPDPIPYRVYIKNHWIDVSTFTLIFNI